MTSLSLILNHGKVTSLLIVALNMTDKPGGLLTNRISGRNLEFVYGRPNLVLNETINHPTHNLQLQPNLDSGDDE